MREKKILIAQGGGPTMVINKSLVGIINQARKKGFKVLGSYNGVNGIINSKFFDFTKTSQEKLNLISISPVSALGSTRDKPDNEYCEKILNVLKKNRFEKFFYIGGNDSSDTLRILSEEAQAADYTLRCVHIPKTIDNDLMVNDHTPGYPSAAKFVASAFVGVNLDNRALPGVYVGVVMGRHAGFLTAAAALARRYSDDGPHLSYLPERNFDVNAFTTDVKAAYDKHGRCVIAVSEGIHDSDGTPILAKLSAELEKDAHGNVQLSGTGALADLLTDSIKANTDIQRVRGDTFGYLQRSFLGCVSKVDQREAREVGIRAVQYAASARRDGTVTIHRVGDYAVDYQLSALSDVAAKTKVMDDSLIAKSATDVTPAFLDYIRPLVGPMDSATRLRAPTIDKILG